MSIFGASSPVVDDSVASVCNTLRVPYLTTATATTSRPRSSTPPGSGGSGGRSFVVHVGPLTWHVTRAVRDTVKEMGWRDVAVVVHKESGVAKRGESAR
jgi:hypothetical protein